MPVLYYYVSAGRGFAFTDTVESRRRCVAMSTILIVILVLLLIGAVPSWPYSRGWGYYPSGFLGLLLLILLILALTGRL
jgi:hypothetical protein